MLASLRHHQLKQLTDIRTLSELKVELAAEQDGATLFIKATYTWEDGLLVFSAYDERQSAKCLLIICTYLIWKLFAENLEET